jgi:hypothetical protein
MYARALPALILLGIRRFTFAFDHRSNSYVPGSRA